MFDTYILYGNLTCPCNTRALIFHPQRMMLQCNFLVIFDFIIISSIDFAFHLNATRVILNALLSITASFLNLTIDQIEYMYIYTDSGN